jgi:hypothetical protein
VPRRRDFYALIARLMTFLVFVFSVGSELKNYECGSRKNSFLVCWWGDRVAGRAWRHFIWDISIVGGLIFLAVVGGSRHRPGFVNFKGSAPAQFWGRFDKTMPI